MISFLVWMNFPKKERLQKVLESREFKAHNEVM